MAESPVSDALVVLKTENELPAELLEEALRCIMQGNASRDDVAALLIALHRRGEGTREIVAGARVLREFMTKIPISNRPVTDTCGTGGTGAGLFNVSTTAAITAAACGVRIAKHGNRRVTGTTGSADVLSELGVAVDASHATVARSIDSIGIGFCFAPSSHPAMRHVAEIRRSLPHPTLFNWLGPLCNPASAERQLLGVGRSDLMEKFPEALKQLGTERFLVLHSTDGLCEISTAEPTRVVIGLEGRLREELWTPEDFGLKRGPWSPAVVSSPQESAALIHRVFDGGRGGGRDLVILNAAAAWWLNHPESTLRDAAAEVANAIDSGRAQTKLAELVRESRYADLRDE